LVKTKIKKFQVTHPTKFGEVKNYVKTENKTTQFSRKPLDFLKSSHFAFPLSSAALALVPFISSRG
jgi:hypothetical protein